MTEIALDVGVGSVLGALILLVALYDYLAERTQSLRQFHDWVLGLRVAGRAAR
jgi:hypothetical protein